MLDRKNYYDVLELPINATQQEIQKSYSRTKNAYSGDSVAMYSLLSPQECEKILEEIEEAYSILSVPEKRREYDRIRGLSVKEFSSNVNTDNQTSPTPQKRQLEVEVENMFDYKGPKPSENFQFSESKMQENKYEEASRHQDVLKFDNESTNSNVKVAKFSAIAQYQLEYEINHEMEKKIENCEEFTGEFLKEIREYKKVSVERLAEMTKISKTYIRNLEANEFTKLPAVVYTRGFVFQIAKSLKLNADLVCNSYMHFRKKSLNQEINGQ